MTSPNDEIEAVPHSPDWQRARRPEQKKQRRDAITTAARSLLDEAGVDGTTLSEIARRAGLSKANCYRYFETREAILLELAIDEARVWSVALRASLAPLSGSGDVVAVANALAHTTADHPRLCSLLSALSSVLEHNVSVGAVADFKRTFNGLIFGTTDAFHSTLPMLAVEQLETFLRLTGPFIAGIWPNANPPPAVAEVLAREEFASWSVQFEPTLAAHTRLLLTGLLAEARNVR